MSSLQRSPRLARSLLASRYTSGTARNSSRVQYSKHGPGRCPSAVPVGCPSGVFGSIKPPGILCLGPAKPSWQREMSRSAGQFRKKLAAPCGTAKFQKEKTCRGKLHGFMYGRFATVCKLKRRGAATFPCRRSEKGVVNRQARPLVDDLASIRHNRETEQPHAPQAVPDRNALARFDQACNADARS